MSKKPFKVPNSTKENDAERNFRWYAEELQHYGYVKRIDREAETMRVLDAYPYKREKHYKSKENTLESFNLLPESNYTYDFRIIWDEKALNLFTEIFQLGGHFKFGKPLFVSHYIEINGVIEIVTYIDVKPHSSAAQFGGGKLSTFYTFPFIQKFLLATKGLYINKIIPMNQGKHGISTNLFATSFTPNRYLFTDASQQLRKIPFKKVSIAQFVKMKSAVIEKLLADIDKKNNKSNQITLL